MPNLLFDLALHFMKLAFCLVLVALAHDVLLEAGCELLTKSQYGIGLSLEIDSPRYAGCQIAVFSMIQDASTGFSTRADCLRFERRISYSTTFPTGRPVFRLRNCQLNLHLDENG